MRKKMTNSKLQTSPITTEDRAICVSGKVVYNERKRKIDLKRPIRDLFDPSLPDVFYIMELCLTEEKAVQRIRELSKNHVLPVILYFVTEVKS